MEEEGERRGGERRDMRWAGRGGGGGREGAEEEEEEEEEEEVVIPKALRGRGELVQDQQITEQGPSWRTTLHASWPIGIHRL